MILHIIELLPRDIKSKVQLHSYKGTEIGYKLYFAWVLYIQILCPFHYIILPYLQEFYSVVWVLDQLIYIQEVISYWILDLNLIKLDRGAIAKNGSQKNPIMHCCRTQDL